MTTIGEFAFGFWNWVLNLDLDKVVLSFVILLLGSTILVHLEESNMSTPKYFATVIGTSLIVLILLVVIWWQ